MEPIQIQPGPEPQEERSGTILKSDILLASLLYPATILIGWWLPDKEINWLIVSLAVIVLHVFMSIKKIPLGKIGVRLFLERDPITLDSGIVFSFWPVSRVVSVSANNIQIQVGSPLTDTKGTIISDPEDTTIFLERLPFRVPYPDVESLRSSPQPTNLPPGVTIPRLPSKEEAKTNPLHRAITTDPQLILLFRIVDVAQFVKVVGDLPQLSHDIDNLARAAFQEVAGCMTCGMMLSHKELVCSIIQNRIEQLIGEPGFTNGEGVYWGVDLLTVSIESPGIPNDVNKAMADAAKAGYEKKRDITASEGAKAARINKGEADAEAKRAEGKAEAENLKAKLDALEGAEQGELIARLEAMVEMVSGNDNAVLIPEDMNMLGGLIQSIQSLSKSTKPN